MSTRRGSSGRRRSSTRSASRHLARYADPSGDAFETLRLAGKALGLPTSLLIDADGCEIGVVAGPADWDMPRRGGGGDGAEGGVKSAGLQGRRSSNQVFDLGEFRQVAA